MSGVIHQLPPGGGVGPVGPVGPQGPAGPKGDPGDPGSGAAPYVHVQSVASAAWTIPHGLGGLPKVTFIDDNGDSSPVAVHYDDDDTVTITFGRPYTGRAVLSL